MTIIRPTSPRIIEIGDVTAGIVVPEQDGTVRFFSAGREFDGLDRHSFRRIDLAMKAMRELLERKSRAGRSAKARPDGTLSRPAFGSEAQEHSSSRAATAGAAAPGAAQFLGFNLY